MHDMQAATPLPAPLPPARALVIRGGGLGDFLLALPWLRALRATGCVVTLVTRPAYAALVAADGLADATLALDGAAFGALTGPPDAVSPRLRAALADATVYSFPPDPDGSVAQAVARLGARAYVQLAARPTAPPHVTAQMFLASGLPLPPDLLTQAVLAGASPAVATGTLWLHPGSGSAAKHSPLSVCRGWAEAWRRAGGRDLVLSFGEADAALVAPALALFADLPHRVLRDPSLAELRAGLAQATAYVGHDTGVTHLAAALGRPTLAVFRTTDPAIWRPLGPRVQLATPATADLAALWRAATTAPPARG